MTICRQFIHLQGTCSFKGTKISNQFITLALLHGSTFIRFSSLPIHTPCSRRRCPLLSPIIKSLQYLGEQKAHICCRLCELFLGARLCQELSQCEQSRNLVGIAFCCTLCCTSAAYRLLASLVVGCRSQIGIRQLRTPLQSAPTRLPLNDIDRSYNKSPPRSPEREKGVDRWSGREGGGELLRAGDRTDHCICTLSAFKSQSSSLSSCIESDLHAT